MAEHTKRLPPLVVGDHVQIQNQTSPHSSRWDKTGVIIEIRQCDRYIVRVDRSGSSPTHNFLRKLIPEQKQPPITDNFWLITTPKPIQPALTHRPPPISPLRGLPPCQQTEAEPLPLTLNTLELICHHPHLYQQEQDFHHTRQSRDPLLHYLFLHHNQHKKMPSAPSTKETSGLQQQEATRIINLHALIAFCSISLHCPYCLHPAHRTIKVRCLRKEMDSYLLI